MHVLVLGAGVIGSVYAGRLATAGHRVTMCARGQRLADLSECGLILEDAATVQRMHCEVAVVATPQEGAPYDVALVAVQRDQMVSTVPLLTTVDADVIFFGNAAGLTAKLANAAGPRTLFGFPGVGGIRDGPVVRYLQIAQQKTMLANSGYCNAARVKSWAAMFRTARFPTQVATDAEAWLTAHAALIVPIAFALYRVDVQPRRLAVDDALLTTMVRATREAFRALQTLGNTEIPLNLRVLYLWMPERFAVRYWRTTLTSPRGELCFAGHSRAAPAEMGSMAEALRSALERSGDQTPDLQALLADKPV